MPLVLSVYMSKTGVLRHVLNWDRNPNLNKCLRTPVCSRKPVFLDIYQIGTNPNFNKCLRTPVFSNTGFAMPLGPPPSGWVDDATQGTSTPLRWSLHRWVACIGYAFDTHFPCLFPLPFPSENSRMSYVVVFVFGDFLQMWEKERVVETVSGGDTLVGIPH